LLSSAILYVAIVAIWAGVLIPRWLRRDTSAATAVSEQEQESEAGEPAEEIGREEETAGTEVGERPGPSSGGRRRRPAEVGGPARRLAEPGGTARRPAEPGGAARSPAEPGGPEPGGAERRPAVPPARDRDRDRARMLAARKRLLGLLVLLAIASGALAERRLAAWWVVLPPIVMLLGYLGLLREAAKADAERLRANRSRTALGPAAAGRSDATSAGGALAGGPEAAERRAEVIEISATWEQVEEEQLYDQVADAKRRAVGD
jgi:hypothetical protein